MALVFLFISVHQKFPNIDLMQKLIVATDALNIFVFSLNIKTE